MCRNPLLNAWIVSVLALACCFWTSIDINAEPIDCKKNGPIEDDPPNNPKKPCGYCKEVVAGMYYTKCDTNPDPTSQACN